MALLKQSHIKIDESMNCVLSLSWIMLCGKGNFRPVMWESEGTLKYLLW